MDRTESAPDAKLGEEPVAIDFEEVAVGSKEQTTTTTATTSKSAAELAEEQRTWHEQRIRQRLQNEYERAGRALSAVVSRAGFVPAFQWCLCGLDLMDCWIYLQHRSATTSMRQCD